MNVMRENQNNMRAWFYEHHPHKAHAQHAPGFFAEPEKKLCFTIASNAGNFTSFEFFIQT